MVIASIRKYLGTVWQKLTRVGLAMDAMWVRKKRRGTQNRVAIRSCAITPETPHVME